MKKIVQHTVVFQPSGTRGKVDDGATILDAARQTGTGIEAVCGGKGVCGKCKVRIEEGRFPKYNITSSRTSVETTESRDLKFISQQELRHGYLLACQTRIHGDIVVFVPEESRKGAQVVRKEASNRKMKVDPAVRSYYVEMEPASLHDTTGDFERIEAVLSSQYGLEELTVDYEVLRGLQETVRKANWKVTVSVWHGREVIGVRAGEVKKAYGLAVDVGTTTVAGYLCDLATGEVVATHSIMNPQVAYGEDVMSRIAYASKDARSMRQMNGAIIKGLNEIAARAAAAAHIRRSDIIDVVLVGNTCMHHLFLNIEPRYLARTPFPPSVHHSQDVKARDLRLRVSPGAYVHVLPIEAGFVGADNVAVLIAEEPYNHDEIALIIDIGTNGELILGNRQKLYSTSCATGPAFEGAEIRHGMRAAPGAIEKVVIDPATLEVMFKVIGSEQWNNQDGTLGALGICGSGIFDVAAQLFLAGIIDKGGRFNKNVRSPRYRITDGMAEFVIAWAKETATGHDIVVCQKDIRAIQLAKGAMYAGARIMMNKMGAKKLDKVVLAGAFGSYIDKISAAVIGLFPDCDPERVQAVGNAAGDGARMALLDAAKRVEADVRAREVEYVELTVEPQFNHIFTQSLIFPHGEDAFPSLKNILAGADKR
jgi:uncharacterized 2Fe-2S/4Fe-4S cluster protein (DUF4445 family)